VEEKSPCPRCRHDGEGLHFKDAEPCFLTERRRAGGTRKAFGEVGNDLPVSGVGRAGERANVSSKHRTQEGDYSWCRGKGRASSVASSTGATEEANY